MNNTLYLTAAFLGGTVIGGVIAWYKTKTIYEKILQDEIASVKEAFSKKEKQEEPNEPEPKEGAVSSADISDSDKRKYGNLTDLYKKPADEPYIIFPDEFGEFDDYETTSLIYFADEVLTDGDEYEVDNPEELVGKEALMVYSQEYGDDSVYVRNDKLKTDFEILLDLRNYSDVLKEKPYLRKTEET